ncbi:MAG: AMIN domain-containing protein [Campylobacteraceae bacterium]|nr:AMIN domain-containing protein [Campylobacteraceae bacterium]
MKKHFIFLLLLSSTLFARENPFAPTDAYLEEVARLMQEGEWNPQAFTKNAEDSNQYENMDSTLEIPGEKTTYSITMVPKKMSEDKMSKKPMKKMSHRKTNTMNDESINAILHKTLKMQKDIEELQKVKMPEKTMQEIVYVKKRMDIPDEKTMYNPLDFVNIQYDNTSIDIDSGKYKVFKKFTIEKENKIILDFRASNLKFYTKRKTINNANFKQIVIGNHKKENYFRVVISLENNPSMYEVNYNENIVSITKNQ